MLPPPPFSTRILTTVHLSLPLSSPFLFFRRARKTNGKGISKNPFSLPHSLFSYTTINWVIKLPKFFWSFLCLLGFHFLCLLGLNIEFLAPSFKNHSKQPKRNTSSPAKGDLELSTEDVEIVMQRTGIPCSQKGRWLEEYMGCDGHYSMFQKREPSSEEVKEAFHVFDSNSDGFIDSMELHKVISNLGYREGLSLEACKQMITTHDENRDGQIDFNEFVKLMEDSFC